MGFFSSEPKIEVTHDAYTKQYNVGKTRLKIQFDKAAYGNIEGETKLLDESIMQSRVEAAIDFIKCFPHSKYCPVPNRIEIFVDRAEEGGEKGASSRDEKGEQEQKLILGAETPRWDFSKVYLPAEVKAQIDQVLLLRTHRDLLYNQWKLLDENESRATILNFYGAPGTGKSMAAEAIAGALEKKIYKVNYAQLESKYVGDTPKNIKYVFEQARKDDAVILFDEADSFLGKRLTNISQSADYGVNISRSVMLLELEKFDGIVIFTTNLLKNYDDAFKRRILASVEFPLPDEAGRTEIFKLYMKGKLPLEEGISAETLGKRFFGVSGADIKDIVLQAALYAIRVNGTQPKLTMEAFDAACQIVRARYTQETAPVTITRERITKEQFEAETGMGGKDDAQRDY